MQNLKQIFTHYVALRLTQDDQVEFSDFPSQASASLKYLSEITNVRMLPVEQTKRERDADPIQPEFYEVEDISTQELIQKRRQNIQNMIKTLPNSLAAQIVEFENWTTQLHRPDEQSKIETVKNLKKAAQKYKDDTRLNDLIKTSIRKISPSIVKASERRKQKATEKKALNKKRFYEIIPLLHATHNPMEKIRLYKELVPLIGFQNEDVKGPVKGGRKRINYELKRDIYKNLASLAFGRLSSRDRERFEDLAEIYQKSLFECLKRSKYPHEIDGKPLGPKGAFTAGGIYGPDSSFAAKKEPVLKQNEPEKSVKVEKLFEPTLFSDKDFEY